MPKLKILVYSIGGLLLLGAVSAGYRAIFLPVNLAIERMAITHSYQYKAA